ncbi:MAG: hypothetical protein V4864_09020 [Pseudomonadota bacterium]
MRRMETVDAMGKACRVVLLTDADLVFCVPYMLLSWIYRGLRKLAFAAIKVPVGLLFIAFSRANLDLASAFVLFPVLIAGASWVAQAYGPYSWPAFFGAVPVLLLGAMLLAKLLVHYYHIEDMRGRVRPGGRISAREARSFDRIRRDAAGLAGSLRHPSDAPVLYLGQLKAMLMLPALCAALLLPAGWLHWALVVFVALFAFNDFERCEHVASHAPHGRLLPPGAPWWARLAEAGRNAASTLFGWFPGQYHVTHALHHHVENNGPADWQSTLRYDRSSVLDFMKAATWLGINSLVPLDTIHYLVQRRRYRILWLLLRGLALYAALLAVVALAEPLLFAILLAERLFWGVPLYAFTGAWHGLHDPAHPQDPRASNHDLMHLAHHTRPRVHLLDDEGLYQTLQQVESSHLVVLLRPEFSVPRGPAGFWRLQGLLWRKDFGEAAQALVAHDSLAEGEKSSAFTLKPGLVNRGIGADRMRALTASAFPQPRGAMLQSLDRKLSHLAGALVRNWHAPVGVPRPRAAT